MGDKETTDVIKKKTEEQLKLLGKQIEEAFLINEKQFKVFSIEATLGKTKTMIKTIREMQRWNPQIKFLIVTKFIDEGNDIQSQIRDSLAYNSDNNKDVEEEELCKYNVLIITHSLYERLCKDANRRRYYIKGRHTLIIDEELNLLKVSQFDNNSIHQMGIILNELSVTQNSKDIDSNINLQESYYKIISGLAEAKDKFNNKQMEFFCYDDPLIEEQIDYLIDLVKRCNMTKEYLKFLKRKYDIKTDKEKIVYQLEMLKKFYNNHNVIVCSRTLYTYDDRHQYFLLRNNILLDASADFNMIYKISPYFDLVSTERIVSHQNTTIHWAHVTTSAYALKHNDGLVENLFQSMILELKPNDKVLVLATEYYLESYKQMLSSHQRKLTQQGIKIEMENFQGMRGKNDWKDFNKCFVLHTPSMGFPYYVFAYKLYGLEWPELTNEDLYTKKIGKYHGFANNAILEELKQTDITSTIYQGIKRINRNNNLQADIYIANNNEPVMNNLFKQLRDVNIVDWKLAEPVKKKRKKRKQLSYNNKKRTNVATNNKQNNIEKIIDYFKNIEPGTYTKKQARESTGILTRKSFTDYIRWIRTNTGELSQYGIKWSDTANTFEKIAV